MEKEIEKILIEAIEKCKNEREIEKFARELRKYISSNGTYFIDEDDTIASENEKLTIARLRKCLGEKEDEFIDGKRVVADTKGIVRHMARLGVLFEIRKIVEKDLLTEEEEDLKSAAKAEDKEYLNGLINAKTNFAFRDQSWKSLDQIIEEALKELEIRIQAKKKENLGDGAYGGDGTHGTGDAR